jgi:hypothetical protein
MGKGRRVRCLKCQDVIQSTHVHDFVRCKCGAIFVDGGSDYLRMGYPPGNPEDHLELLEEESNAPKG